MKQETSVAVLSNCDPTSSGRDIVGILRRSSYRSCFSDSKNDRSLNLSTTTNTTDKSQYIDHFDDLEHTHQISSDHDEIKLINDETIQIKTSLDNEPEFMYGLQINHISSSIDPGKGVSFDSLHILEFLPSLGDNPACRCGPPISLRREHSNERFVDLEEYEASKIENNVGNRCGQDLYISSFARRWALTEEGEYSLEDIRRAQNDVDLIKKNRKMSVERQKMEISYKRKLQKLKKIIQQKKMFLTSRRLSHGLAIHRLAN